MKREFKVGDRVAVYGRAGEIGMPGNIICDGTRGTVVRIYDSRWLEVNTGKVLLAHPKQCRRLRERKRIWVNWYKRSDGTEDGFAYLTEKEAERSEERHERSWCREFVEVRRRK